MLDDVVNLARSRRRSPKLVEMLYSDGILLIGVNRLLQAGAYFIWSAPPVYKNEEKQKNIWKGWSSAVVTLPRKTSLQDVCPDLRT